MENKNNQIPLTPTIIDGPERINSIFLNILSGNEEHLIRPSASILGDLKNVLNGYLQGINCKDIIFTLNTDKPFFGIKVQPVLNSSDALNILLTDEKMKLKDYNVELDSKLFSVSLDSDELTAYLIHEITSMMGSYNIVDQARSYIDISLLNDDSYIKIRDSVNYSQLFIFGLCDTFYKLSSAIFKEDPEDLISNIYIQQEKLESSLLSALDKVNNSIFGFGDSVKEPKIIILQWVFTVYSEIKLNNEYIKDTLRDASEFSASRLDQNMIERTLKSVDAILSMNESATLTEVFRSGYADALNEISLFKSLKSNGLRSIEDAYYELLMRAKACETEEEAMYVLRGINTRINILEDYLFNEPNLSDNERKRWELLAIKYRELRNMLAKKKIMNKKQYGIYIDYNKFDELDQ